MKTTLSHIAIWTRNIERSKMFYQRYFDGVANYMYHNPTKGFSSYFVRFDGGVAIEIMQRTDITTENDTAEHIGLAHIAFTVGSRENVHTLIEQLRSDGYIINSKPRLTGDGYYEASILDPDNNIIEIVA